MGTVLQSYLEAELVGRVIVVDDGSFQHIRPVVDQIAGRYSSEVVFIRHPQRMGVQVARETGVAAAAADWILLGEDDVWIEPDYVSTLLEEAENYGADIIAGRLVDVHIPGEFERSLLPKSASEVVSPSGVFNNVELTADFGAVVPAAVPALHLHAVALVRRRVFERVHYDPSYRGSGWREETDFFMSARSQGFRVMFSPKARCFHLRGRLCSTGGQRVNRLAFEWYALVNSFRLVRKHWRLLSGADPFAFRGGPAAWTARFFITRQKRQLARLLRGKARSSLR